MADKSLAYFMRSQNKEERIVEIPGVPSIVDEKGNVIPFKVRVLSHQKITDIFDSYKKREVYTDKKGNPVVSNGQVVFKVDNQSQKAMRRILVEALVYPDLKNKELMDYYECYSFDDMPGKLFPDRKEYEHVSRCVYTALGILDDEDNESEVNEAKNS